MPFAVYFQRRVLDTILLIKNLLIKKRRTFTACQIDFILQFWRLSNAYFECFAVSVPLHFCVTQV